MNSKENAKMKEWKEDAERQDYAIEALAMSVQFALQKAMNENCVTQKELSERLGVSPARVSQILANDATNLTLKTIGKIADALGEEFELFSLRDIKKLKAKPNDSEAKRPNKVVNICNFQQAKSWVDQSAANDRLDRSDFNFAVGQ